MFKKLFAAVGPEEAVTVPLAGVAWADDPPADGVGAHGVGKGVSQGYGDAYPDQIGPEPIPPARRFVGRQRTTGGLRPRLH